MQILRKDPIKKMKQHLTVTEKIFAYWKKNGFADKYSSDLVSWAFDFILHDLKEGEFSSEEKVAIAKKLDNQLKIYEIIVDKNSMDARTKNYYKELKAFAKG